MTISNTTIAYDQKKMLAAKLIARATNRLVAASLCDKVKQEEGTGKVAYFVRYSRMFVPLTTLTEGTAGTASDFTLEQFSVTLDQWGDFCTLTDVAKLTASHPLVQQATELLADNAQRVIDREVQLVWLAGTNVQYADGSITARASITTNAAYKLTDLALNKARVTMQRNGAPERNGPADQDFKLGSTGSNKIGAGAYVAVCGPEVMADLMATGTSFGTLAAVSSYQAKETLYTGEFGAWLGFRWVMSNFVPKIAYLGDGTAAVASAASFGTDTPVVTGVTSGGSLTSSTAYYFAVTRIDKLRGFEEGISMRHSQTSTSTSNNESFTFDFAGLTAGYVYNVYFGASDADSALHLANSTPAAVGDVVTVTAVPTSAITKPANSDPSTKPTVHPIFIHAAESTKWVGLQDLKVMTAPATASDSDPLAQRHKISYKFMGKALLCDQTRLLRLEVASAY